MTKREVKITPEVVNHVIAILNEFYKKPNDKSANAVVRQVCGKKYRDAMNFCEKHGINVRFDYDSSTFVAA